MAYYILKKSQYKTLPLGNEVIDEEIKCKDCDGRGGWSCSCKQCNHTGIADEDLQKKEVYLRDLFSSCEGLKLKMAHSENVDEKVDFDKLKELDKILDELKEELE